LKSPTAPRRNYPFIRRLVAAVLLILSGFLLYAGRAGAAGGADTAPARGAGKSQSGAAQVEPVPRSLPTAQTGIATDAGDGPLKPYTPPPKSDRARRPAVPGSDLVIFSAPRKLSKAQEMLLPPSAPVSTFTIVIVPGAGLAANPAALLAFEKAAEAWEERFTDPITVIINADMASLGPGILGSTSAQLLTASYSTIRNAMVTDAGSSAADDDSIAASLPTAAQFLGTLPSGFGFDGNVFATKANLKALGFTGLDAIVGTASDGEIVFSSDFAFDYDRSDGVSAGTFDFQTVATHEIGHLLGFISAVDDVDFVLPGTSSQIEPTPLDLYRFRLGSGPTPTPTPPTTAAGFTNTPRNFVPQHEAVTSDTVSSPRMSTGLDFGDGRQASHWKDDSLTGTLVGNMDPTLSPATVNDPNETDFHAFDLIGYDFVANVAPVASATPNPAVTDEDTSVQITLNGTDDDDDDLTFEITDAPDNGSLGTVSAPDCSAADTCTATVTYTPAADFNGADSFKFKANDGALDSAEVTVNVTVNAVPDFTISDVSKAEGNSGTTSFTFNVTKEGAGAASVDYATQDWTAEEGSDYAANSGTLVFASGDTTKEITVLVNGDTTPEVDEEFDVVLSNPSGAAINDDTGTGTIRNDEESVGAGQLIISEFRLRGPGGPPFPADGPAKGSPLSSAAMSPCGASRAVATGGKKKPRTYVLSGPRAVEPDTSPEANDEFIELYNNTDTPLLVTTTDGSEGWAVAASDGLVRFIIPQGTVIPARGHFLSPNLLGYSLYGYPAGDGSFQPPFALGDYVIRGDGTDCFGYELDIPDNAGIALFRTSNPANFDTDTRLDAVGSTSETDALYKEGDGYPALTPDDISKNLEHSFYRSLCSFAGACTTPGVPKDSGNNAADFFFVDTEGTQTAAGRRLGAPAPENLASPVQMNTRFSLLPLDRTVATSAAPNRVRDLTEDGANNSTFGTLSVRRRLTNNTTEYVTGVRFRIVELTTHPAPAGVADLRARDAADDVIEDVGDEGTCSSAGAGPAPCDVNVVGATLEQPPLQGSGGGYNSSLSVGTITFDDPLPPGESVNVQFLLGIQQTGSFRFLLNIEAVTEGCSCPAPTAPARRGARAR
jgi:hypothetical protein